jgi:hypothetical protein
MKDYGKCECRKCKTVIYRGQNRVDVVSGPVDESFCIDCYKFLFGLDIFRLGKDFTPRSNKIDYYCHSCNRATFSAIARMIYVSGVASEMNTIVFHPDCFAEMCTTSFIENLF